MFNHGKPVNITNFQQMTEVSSKVDDGIVCITTNPIKFLKCLMEGKHLKPSSMKKMLDSVNDEKAKTVMAWASFILSWVVLSPTDTGAAALELVVGCCISLVIKLFCHQPGGYCRK